MVFLEVFLKISQISLRNICTGYNVNVKIWLYAFNIFIIKRIPRTLVFQSVLEIFKNVFLLKHSWASASDFKFDIFQWNKYMKVRFFYLSLQKN